MKVCQTAITQSHQDMISTTANHFDAVGTWKSCSHFVGSYFFSEEEKRTYDREFLLALQYIQENMKKPEGLPDITGIVLDKTHFLNKVQHLKHPKSKALINLFQYLP